MLTQTIPSYLYQQYADDDDLQAFVAAYNEATQTYVDWFAQVSLPYYPGLSGDLLTWVGQGLYGLPRTAIQRSGNTAQGPLNSLALNTQPLNFFQPGVQTVFNLDDDSYQRILTWNFYKGDGNTFDIRWLKRRIMRFLIGVNGSAPNVDQTYAISVTTGPGIISIRINTGTRTVLSGPYNTASYNSLGYNSLRTRFNPAPVQFPLAGVLQEAMRAGVLQMPFQYDVTITI